MPYLKVDLVSSKFQGFGGLQFSDTFWKEASVFPLKCVGANHEDTLIFTDCGHFVYDTPQPRREPADHSQLPLQEQDIEYS